MTAGLTRPLSRRAYSGRLLPALALALAGACASVPGTGASAVGPSVLREADCYRLDLPPRAVLSSQPTPPGQPGHPGQEAPAAAYDWDALASVCQRAATDPRATTGAFAIASYHVGRARNELKDYAEAINTLDLALSMPGVQKDLRRRILLTSGRAKIGQRVFPAAIDALREALILGPEDLDTRMSLGEAYLGAGQPDLASSEFEAVVALAGRDRTTHAHTASAALTRLGAIAIAAPGAEGPAAALRYYEAARSWDEMNPEAWLGAGAAGLRLAQGRQGVDAHVLFEQAEIAFRRAGRLAPAAVEAQTGLGEALFGLGRMEDALSAYARAVELAPASAGRRLDLARAQARAGRMADAERTYDEVNRLEASARSYYEMAGVQLALGAADRARDSLMASQRLDPAFAGAFLGLGRLLFDKGPQHFPAAADQFRQAERLGQAGDTALRAEALYYLSRIETEGGGKDARLAARYAEQAMALDSAPASYRAQACLVRIRFLTRETSVPGPGTCAPVAQSPQAYLLSGMYHLRLAHFAAGDDRKRNWEDAYLAFATGQQRIDQAPESERPSLRERLAFGQGLSLYCVGFADVGRQATGQASNDVRAYFDTYHVARCETY